MSGSHDTGSGALLDYCPCSQRYVILFHGNAFPTKTGGVVSRNGQSVHKAKYRDIKSLRYNNNIL